MSYNSDELVAPEWVNSDFLKKVIDSSGFGKNIKIHDYNISPSTAVGDHFASIMFRANVNFSSERKSTEKISLIIKAFPVEEGFKKEALSAFNFFETEIYVYKKILNDCEKLLNKIGYTEMFAPKLLYASLEPHQVIVLADLKELGYFMLPTNIPSDHEVRLIFAKLAQFHAMTFKMNADGRDDLKYKGTVFNIAAVRKMDTYTTGCTFMAEVLDTVPEFKSYATKLRGISSDWLIEKCIELVNGISSYNVLNHGDFHTRNLMFKKNKFEAVSEAVLVDFQIPHWGSPAFDLTYMASAIAFGQRDMAYRHYFNVFSDVLVKSGYKGKLPTFEDLMGELKKFACLDLLLVSSVGLFMRLDREKLQGDDLTKLLTDTEFRRTFYKMPSYVDYIKEAVPKLLEAID